MQEDFDTQVQIITAEKNTSQGDIENLEKQLEEQINFFKVI